MNDAKTTFVNSLSDEQLGFFYAHEYEPNLDDLLQDQLNIRQFGLFEQWKEEEAILTTRDSTDALGLQKIEDLLEKLTVRMDKMEENAAKQNGCSSTVLDKLTELTNRLDEIEKNNISATAQGVIIMKQAQDRCSELDLLFTKVTSKLEEKHEKASEQHGHTTAAIWNKLTELEILYEKLANGIDEVDGNNRLTMSPSSSEESLKPTNVETTVNTGEQGCTSSGLDLINLYPPPPGNSMKRTTGQNSLSPCLKIPEASSHTNAGGVIFSVGGLVTFSNTSHGVQIYDPKESKWIDAGYMSQGRRNMGLVGANGKLYAIGGRGQNGVGKIENLASAEVFDPITGLWQGISPMSKPTRGFGAASADGIIFAIGGEGAAECFRIAEKYDIEQNLWTQMPSMMVSRGGVGCAVLDGFVYAVGGHDDWFIPLDSCERYNPHSSEWEMIASMSQERYSMGICALNGFIYAVGGYNRNGNALSSVERYDCKSNTWTQLANLSSPRGHVAVAVMDGSIYAIGGVFEKEILKSAEVYSTCLDTWTPVADLNRACNGAGAAWVDCSLNDLLAVFQKNAEAKRSSMVQ